MIFPLFILFDLGVIANYNPKNSDINRKKGLPPLFHPDKGYLYKKGIFLLDKGLFLWYKLYAK